MTRISLLSAFLLCSTAPAALAQAPARPAGPPPVSRPTTPPAAASATPPADTDRVVATVNGQDIRMSDLADMAQSLPEQLRGMPPQMLYPMLVDQLVDRRILVIAARKQGLDKDPAVQRLISRATDTTLQNALLTRDIAPSLTEDAIRARYDRDYAKKQGEPEVHARHILVKTEDEAKKVIADLKGGKDFSEEAKAMSTDQAANAQGGDLGWFKAGDMVPAFATAAFALKDGEVSPTPVQTQFGWHVIQTIEHRTAPPPAFEEVHDEIRQALIQDGVKHALDAARVGVTVKKFAQDGSAMPDAPAGSTPANGSPAASPPGAAAPAAPPAK